MTMITGTTTTDLRLFLYGTLRPDAGTAMADWIGQRLIRAEPGWVPGRLHALPDPCGWYPALVPGAGRVTGMCVELRLRAGDRALLDRYEGREYRRVSLPVRHARKRSCAQAYVWRAGLPQDAVAIGPDFLEWLRDAGCAPYASSRS